MAKSDSQVVYKEYFHSIIENCITSFRLNSVLRHVTFFSRNLFLCLHLLINSFRLFKIADSGLQIIKYFSAIHKLQRFVTFV